MRIEKLADDLYDCNYIMFQNTAYGTKWFYAFILEVNYINDKTTEIVYELDVMQTWYFDYEPQSCYIEREHTATDEIGDNIIDENLPIGEYQYKFLLHPDMFEVGTSERGMKICVFTAALPGPFSGLRVKGQMITNLYSGVAFLPFDVEEVGTGHTASAQGNGDINNFVNDLTSANAIDSVVNIVMLPSLFVTWDPSQGWFPDTPNDGVSININKSGLNTIGNYTPRNKKLLTAPYNQLYVTDGMGGGFNFPQEFFNDPQYCVFKTFCFIAPQPELSLIPQNYKGVPFNNNERLICTNFPICSFNVDSFKAWLAQHRFENIGKLIGFGSKLSNAITSISGQGASGNYMGAASSAVNAVENAKQGVLNSIMAVASASTLPDQARGQATNGINALTDYFAFTFYQAYIHPQYAAVIDDYFDRFGYACKRNKVPGVSNMSLPRPNWGYIKTIGCTITGSIPADDQRKIVNIYNSGITFWADGDNVGDYTLNNAPVTPTP